MWWTLGCIAAAAFLLGYAAALWVHRQDWERGFTEGIADAERFIEQITPALRAHGVVLGVELPPWRRGGLH